MRFEGRAGLLLLCAVVMCVLAGCTAIPGDAWRVEPIAYDNALEGDSASFTDVTYPMGHMTDDTLGGIWTESAGSWLHLDAVGKTVRRFNLEDERAVSTVRGIAALNATELVVSHDARGDGQALSIFDTAGMRWRDLPASGDWIGDVAVENGRIFYVEYVAPPMVPTRFVIRELDLATGAVVTLADDDDRLIAEDAKIAVDGGEVYLVTETATLVLVDGLVTADTGSSGASPPYLSLGGDGDLVAPTDDAAAAEVSTAVVGGSREARRVLELAGCEGRGGLTLRERDAWLRFPDICQPRSVEWLGDGSFVASLGTESGAVLARFMPPTD
ncbi:hypothetical protein ACGGZK_07050 [Agromyces sp. MMS24-K17]|uniref:hypothetical protein n=1 Tax=Agromyces sp. MMS24-K17 TaxID=3372850 RepID=UPI003754C7B8